MHNLLVIWRVWQMSQGLRHSCARILTKMYKSQKIQSYNIYSTILFFPHMKVTIIGVVDPAINYHDWEIIFRRHFRDAQLSEICITGRETLLNEYVKTYAGMFSIPVSVYDFTGHSAEARLCRSIAMIQDSDLLIAFTNNNNEKSFPDEITGSLEHGVKALIINTEEQPSATKIYPTN